MLESFYSIIILLIILSLIVLTLYFYKKTMGGFNGNQDIMIINQLSVGSKERLLLLKIKEDVILIGVTPHNISTLHVCDSIRVNSCSDNRL